MKEARIPKWHVFYTKSRTEKKAYHELQKVGIEACLPLKEEIRQWSDRKKKVETPLFKSYIFVKCREHEIYEIIQNNPFTVTFIRFRSGPAVVRDEEMSYIQKIVESGLEVIAEGYDDLMEGDPVKVVGGPLKGLEGTLIERKNQEVFTVNIEAIKQSMKISLPKQYLEPLNVNQ